MNNLAKFFVCAKTVHNNFPLPSEIYLCGLKEPVHLWLAIKEIKAGQIVILVRNSEHKALYLVGSDCRVIQVSGPQDLLLETKDIIPNTHWIAITRMVNVMLNHMFMPFTINYLTKHKEKFEEFQRQVYEYVFEHDCSNWLDCKLLVKQAIKKYAKEEWHALLLKGWGNPSRPSIKVINQPMQIIQD